MSLSIRGNGVTGVFFLPANSKKLVNKLLCIPLSVVYPVQFYFLVVFPGIGQFQEPQSNSFATPLPEPQNPVPLKRLFVCLFANVCLRMFIYGFFYGRDIQEILQTAKSLDSTATATYDLQCQ